MFVSVTTLLLYKIYTVPVILHVTEIDPDGKVLWSGEPNSYELSDVQIMNTLNEWIEHCRTKPDDAPVQQLFKRRCLDLTEGRAYKDMATAFVEWEREQTKPENVGNRLRVKVHNFVRQKEGVHVYRFYWHETWSPMFGSAPSQYRLSGLVTVELRSQRGPFGMFFTAGDRSPTGLYVVDYTFSAQETRP
jgi:type IV secretory pathway TrbF-like protein